MKRADVYKYSAGSAEEVIAHAAWQRSKGRNPSMSFVGEHNPRKALALANSIVCTAQRTKLVNSIGAVVEKCKSYDDMSDDELTFAARHIICTSSSKEEVQQRLRDEINYPYTICLEAMVPTDAIGREARELVRGLGGLVMANGAMAMVMMYGHNGEILNL